MKVCTKFYLLLMFQRRYRPSLRILKYVGLLQVTNDSSVTILLVFVYGPKRCRDIGAKTETSYTSY